MTTKDGKWKPAKVIKINRSGPRSYNIVTPLGQQYRRNRKDLRKVTGSTGIGTNFEDCIDDEVSDTDLNETFRGNCDNSESVPELSKHRSDKLVENEYMLTNTRD